jgi:general secretion pathway protein L
MDKTLQKLQVRYVAPVLRQFNKYWAWWTGELIPILPEHMQAAILQQDQRIQIEIDGRDFVLNADNGTESAELGRIARDAEHARDFELPVPVTETRLVLPADKVLVKQLTLPLSIEENLREALSFQMDRQTPFSVDQVYYDCHVRARDNDNQTLTVELVVTPRDYVDELLDSLADNGLSPDRISAPDKSSDGLLSVNLLPAARRRKNRIGLSRRRNLLLVTANLVLAAAVLATPVIQKQRVIRILEPQLQEAIEEARSGTELRQQVEQLAAASEYLRNKKQTELLVMRAVDEITRLLPDNTWASRLDIDTGEIQLQGESSSSAALIQLLEASPLLQNVRFRSPVIRIGNTEEDRFHLSADLVQEQSQ